MPIYIKEGANQANDSITIAGFTAGAPDATGLNGSYDLLEGADRALALTQITSTRYSASGETAGVVANSRIFGNATHLVWNRSSVDPNDGGWHITARDETGVWAFQQASGHRQSASVGADFDWAKLNGSAETTYTITDRTNITEVVTNPISTVFNQTWSGDPNNPQPARFITLNSNEYYDFNVRATSNLTCGTNTSTVWVNANASGFAPQFVDPDGNNVATGNIEFIATSSTTAQVAGLSGAGAGTGSSGGVNVIHNVGGVAANTTFTFPDSVNSSGYAGGNAHDTGVAVEFVEYSFSVGQTRTVEYFPCPRSGQANVSRTISATYNGFINGRHDFTLTSFSATNCVDFSPGGFAVNMGEVIIRSAFTVTNNTGSELNNFAFTAGGTTSQKTSLANGESYIHDAIPPNTNNGWSWTAANSSSETEEHTITLTTQGSPLPLTVQYTNSAGTTATSVTGILNFDTDVTCTHSPTAGITNGTSNGSTPVNANFIEETGANVTITEGGESGGTVRNVRAIWVNDGGTVREVTHVFENDAGTPREVFGPTIAPIAAGTSVTVAAFNSPGPAGSDAVNPDPNSAACADVTGNNVWRYGGRSACCCSQKISGFRASVWPGDILSFEVQEIEYGRVRWDIHGSHGCGNCCDCCQRATYSRCFWAPHSSFQFAVSTIFDGSDFIQGATNPNTQGTGGANFVFTFNPNWNDGTVRARDWRPWATSGGFSGCCGDRVRVGLVYDYNDPTTWNLSWGGCKSTCISLTAPSTSIGASGSGGRPCGCAAFVNNGGAIRVFTLD